MVMDEYIIITCSLLMQRQGRAALYHCGLTSIFADGRLTYPSCKEHHVGVEDNIQEVLGKDT